MFDDLTIQKFWSKVDKSAGPDACWPWVGSKNNKGYGLFYFQGKNLKAHRVSLTLDSGRYDLFMLNRVVADQASLACHSCNNPICVNPDHLRWDSPSGNTGDIPDDTRAAMNAKAAAAKEATGNYGGIPAGSFYERNDYAQSYSLRGENAVCAAKLQRLAAYEAALREIVAEANKFGTDAGLSYAAIIAEGALAADRFELENGA